MTPSSELASRRNVSKLNDSTRTNVLDSREDVGIGTRSLKSDFNDFSPSLSLARRGNYASGVILAVARGAVGQWT